jgi:hypothetical protein
MLSHLCRSCFRALRRFVDELYVKLEGHGPYPRAHFQRLASALSQKISITSATTAPSEGVRHMHIVVQFRAVRSLDIPRPSDAAWWGARSPRKFAGAPTSSVSNVLRQRCDARGFTPLPIEIIAARKVAPAFEPRNCRGRTAGPGLRRNPHDEGLAKIGQKRARDRAQVARAIFCSTI